MKKPLIVASIIACSLLVLAVMGGAGDVLVYALTALAMAGVGAVIYLTQNSN